MDRSRLLARSRTSLRVVGSTRAHLACFGLLDLPDFLTDLTELIERRFEPIKLTVEVECTLL